MAEEEEFWGHSTNVWYRVILGLATAGVVVIGSTVAIYLGSQ